MHEMLCFAVQKRVSEDGWGSLSGGRFRDGPGYARIMVGSATHWNCEFRRRFADLLARSSIVCCNSVFANRIGMAASRLLGAGAACIILNRSWTSQIVLVWLPKAAIVICQQIF